MGVGETEALLKRVLPLPGPFFLESAIVAVLLSQKKH